MDSDEQKHHCCKCGRKVRPKWKVVKLIEMTSCEEFKGWGELIGPTCKKKLVARGVPESAFEMVKK